MANGGCIPTQRIVAGEKCRVIEPPSDEMLCFREFLANKINYHDTVTRAVVKQQRDY